MAVSERDRRLLFDRLEDTLGAEAADSMMELLPDMPTSQLATRDDVTATAIALRGEMAELRGEMAELRGELSGEMAELRAELRGEMASLAAELRGEMAELRADVRTEIAGLQRWGAGIVAANAVAVLAALFV
ncbi:MAG: hypothetical protein GY724_15905 [Actinomycetia bacterium]|nr:hypothetical protein [Actinomycetes bacterium]MCP4227391.1 hypothetical protein [Actinomycetes bacterium]MCP5030282.1 hypothetical protein [Actinomycetes bacterium]